MVATIPNGAASDIAFNGNLTQRYLANAVGVDALVIGAGVPRDLDDLAGGPGADGVESPDLYYIKKEARRAPILASALFSRTSRLPTRMISDSRR